MTPQQAQFDNTASIYFDEAKRKRFDLTRNQAGMFLDRPDLWRKPQRKRKAPPVNQIPMFLESNPAYQPT